MVATIERCRLREAGELPVDLACAALARANWTVADYLALDGNYLVEYRDGYIEVLPMPDMRHQDIAERFGDMLKRHLNETNTGKMIRAPFRIRLWEERFREPDLAVMLRENAGRMTNAFWNGADLVVEVLSESNRDHDLTTKVEEYARAGINEYWILDPKHREVRVLSLVDGRYQASGPHSAGTSATSRLLPGFAVDIAAIFAVG